jgi:PhzF family phenazine biosynthesis protein
MKRRFVQCDVFTSQPTRGNGLAVVVDAEGLSVSDMQAFSAWTNLAETTFLMAPEHAKADYKVRIFTPSHEMPFAGHPTLGSCAAWLRTGGVPAEAGIVRQECAVGIIEIETDGAAPAFVAPPTRIEPLPEGAFNQIVGAFGIAPERVVRMAWLDNGPVWHVLELESAEDVLAVDTAKVRWPDIHATGLIGPHGAGGECDFEVRMLCAESSMGEDPITGSLNAAIARWMHEEGRLTRDLKIAQGTRLGRHGRVHMNCAGHGSDRVTIGGETQILIEGTLEL